MPTSHRPNDQGGTARFVIEEKLGEGAMGAVYRAYDPERRHRVALKTLVRMDPVSLYHFKQEFRSLAGVTHRNLATLYELVSEEDRWFFTMELIHGIGFLEYVRGKDADQAPDSWTSADTGPPPSSRERTAVLSTGSERGPEDDTMTSVDAVKSPHRAKPERLRPAFLQLAEGLHYLHDTGHLHRDIKPSNVLVNAEARVVILDFGVVARAGEDAGQAHEDPAGTPAYMAPEQTLAGNAPTRACDWYSFGVILYEALTGRRPFRGTVKQLLEVKRKRDARPVHELAPDAPDDLATLCEALLKRDPAARPVGEEIIAALSQAPPSRRARTAVPDGETLLIGRARELAELRAALASAENGDGVALFVSGESGMGKSTLVQHFLRQLGRSDRVVVLTGRCHERETVPYKAVDSLVDSLARYLASLPRHVAEPLMPVHVRELARVFPVMRRIEAVAEARRHAQETALDPTELRSRAFGALREVFARIAARTPLVLFIDDLQWGDVDSAPLIADLMKDPAPPLLLLGSFRSEAADSSPLLRALFDPESETALHRERRRDLRVSRLPLPQARELADRLLAAAGLPADLAELIARESSGNPFFVHELARFAALPNVRADQSSMNMDAVIGARVQALGEASRRLLEVVSVAGVPMPYGIIRRAAGLAEAEPQAFAELRGARWIRSAGARDADPIEIYHQRMRETVLDAIDPIRRRELHLRIAQAIETSERPDPRALAAHFNAAGERSHALEYAVRAATDASESLAFEAAAEFYLLALDILASSPGLEDERRELLIQLGDALRNAGRGSEAAGCFLDAAVGAARARSIELRRRAAFEYLRGGHLDEGKQVLQRLLADFGYRLAPTPTRAVMSLLRQRLRLRLRGLGSRLRDASELPEHELLRIDTCYTAALGLSTADTIRAADFGTRCLLLSLRAGEPRRLADALLIESGLTATRGTPARKRTFQIIDRVQSIAEDLDDPALEAWGNGCRALAHYQNGEFRPAADKAGLAVDILRSRTVGTTWERDSAELYRIWAWFYLGRLGEIAERVPTLITEARRRGDVFATANLQLGVPAVGWLVRGAPREARRRAEEAMSLWSKSGFLLQHCWKLFSDVQCDLYEGQARAAIERVTETWPALEKSMLLRIQILRIEMLHMRGRAAVLAAAEDGDGALLLRQADRDARSLASERHPAGPPLAELLRAGAASARGDQAAAEQALERAERAAEASEMHLYRYAARRRRGQLVGGEKGERLAASAEAWMRDRRVHDLDAFTAMLAPVRIE